MAPATADEIVSRITDELASTEYACSSLEPLSGGTANFLFKGKLQNPLQDGTAEVAVKHGEGFSASLSTLELSTRRCVRFFPLPFFLAFFLSWSNVSCVCDSIRLP